MVKSSSTFCAIQPFLVLILLFFWIWKCITISLDITVSRRFGRALIPASGLFLCTAVIMVREVYLSFLRHRHLPSRQKISNAMLSRVAKFSPPHLNRAKQNCCNRLTYIPAIHCNTKKIPPYKNIHLKAPSQKNIGFRIPLCLARQFMILHC